MAGGINVAVVSRHAEAIEICLFDESGGEEMWRFRLPHRLGDVHYGFVAGPGAGTRYGLRAHGPGESPHRFDPSKLLIDPYATAIDRPFCHMPEFAWPGTDTAPLMPKCVVRVPPDPVPPLPPKRPDFIYEVQVKSFTRLHPDIPEGQRGTVASLAHPSIIAHLKRLGVDCLELMPLMAWIDERHLPSLGLANAWGYNPVSFMVPDPRLVPGGFEEIRRMVNVLHAEGIRVVLDVVFNHTGESDAQGATLSLRGLDNALYFTGGNESGCGNTLAADRAPVVQLVLDALRCWVNETGLDGFRFDLATVLGHSLDAPLLAAIAQDPLLKDLCLIAEPWDLSTYRLGGFPAPWLEWNDRYRDDVRRFWRGDRGSVNAFATRLTGSSDIFAPHRPPSCSINYVAAHDGFTLFDLTRFATKQNQANGEGNRDGNDHEVTWPGGNVHALLATLFLSRGTVMLTAGDEFGRSQNGNNNAYAQDNELTWLDWSKADRKLIAFVSELAGLRRQLVRDAYLGEADVKWLGHDGLPMNWHDADARIVGLDLGDHVIWINGGSGRLPVPDGFTRRFTSGEGEGLPPQSVTVLAPLGPRRSGAADDAVKGLATEAGIALDWWEVDGTHHLVPVDTLRHILRGLGLAHTSAADVAESLRSLKARQCVRIVREGERFHLGKGPATILPRGVHDVSDDRGNTHHVLVAPSACYLPEDIAAGRRAFGLSSHLYALRHAGDGGLGDFETLRRFAKLTTALGGSYTGLNPLHHMFPADRSRVSPYQPSDRRFIDPIYISISQLLEDLPLPKTRRLAETHRAAFERLEGLDAVDYVAHWQAKSAILESACAEFNGSSGFESFVSSAGESLRRHGVFEASLAGETPSPARIRYRAFLQFVAEGQLKKAAEASTLYRDLALGSAFDGGEIAGDPQAFVSTVSLGAPPDPFARNGQVWNLPAFSPLELEARGLAPMRHILHANMRHAAALRIDHVLGFARQFWVPRGAEGKDGAYVRFPMAALIALTAIESHEARCLVVGEDLGTVPDGLRQALHEANILSYRVLWFEREGDGFRAPRDYPARALACLASHDLPTFKGWRCGRDIAIEEELGLLPPEKLALRHKARREEIAALDQSTGSNSADDADASVAAHGFVAASPSSIMLIQADDLAEEVEPLNVPGTDKERPNWRRRIRVSVDELGQRPLTRRIVKTVRKARGHDRPCEDFEPGTAVEALGP